jgi:glycosyltransferase involved in cell wall biosynthesis
MLEVGRRSDLVITVSESSRKDIFRHLHIPAEQQDKVLAIPEGVSDRFRPAEKEKRDHPVILYVGRFDPYKNVVGLIEAFARVVRECPGTRLRMIGPPDARYPEPRRRAVELKVDDHITWQGYVDGDELLRAYQQADVMVLPSRYEGFGLPVLEAMACGVPVVCSNTSSLPEVAGDAALLVDPADVGQCAQAITSVLTDPSRAGRLRQKGIERASEFTWRRTAEMTRRAYESAV